MYKGQSMRNCWVFGTLFFCAIGCGGPSFVPVSGTVTLDDKPLPNATVGFYPLGAKPGAPSLNSSGKTNDKGEFTLSAALSNNKGAVVGKHRVSITLEPDLIGTSDLPANKLPKGGKPPKMPAKYQGEGSELTCDVPSGGKSDANFSLKSN
jgi:hypothetical protein